jgi:hypothetical protein
MSPYTSKVPAAANFLQSKALYGLEFWHRFTLSMD